MLLSSQSYAVSIADVERKADREGLTVVYSRYLDRVFLRGDTNLSAYRRVMIDPMRVDFDERWLNYVNHMVPPVGEENLKRIAEGIALEAHANVARAFHDRGFMVVDSLGAGVLRLSSQVSDLYVNAPDRLQPWLGTTFTKDAGEATLLFEARDSTSDLVIARIVHRGTAVQMGRFSWTTGATGRMWFGELIRRWAIECASVLEASTK